MKKKRSDAQFRYRVGVNVKTLLVRRGLNQESLTRKAGLSSGMVSRIVHGLRGPSLETALKLAEALECDIKEIYQ